VKRVLPIAEVQLTLQNKSTFLVKDLEGNYLEYIDHVFQNAAVPDMNIFKFRWC